MATVQQRFTIDLLLKPTGSRYATKARYSSSSAVQIEEISNFLLLQLKYYQTSLWLDLSDLFLQSFKVDRETCENLKALFSSFKKKRKQYRKPGGFQFQGGESQRAEQGVVSYFTTPWCWSTDLALGWSGTPFNQGGESQRAEQGFVKILRLPGAEALCASGWEMM